VSDQTETPAAIVAQVVNMKPIVSHNMWSITVELAAERTPSTIKEWMGKFVGIAVLEDQTLIQAPAAEAKKEVVHRTGRSTRRR
jgi:hypothetical protein